MAKGSNTDLAIVFGGGKSAPGRGSAPMAGPMAMKGDSERSESSPDDEGAEGEDSPPSEFGVHVREAFPDLGDDQVQALYRAIRSCSY